MKRIINKFALLIAVAVAGLTVGLTPVEVHAGLFDGARDAACSGAALQENATCDTTGDGSSINRILATTLNLLSIVVGVVAVIVIIISGLRLILSQGDSNSVASARNSLLYALIGLVIVALAQFIVRFVLGRVSTPPPQPTQGTVRQL